MTPPEGSAPATDSALVRALAEMRGPSQGRVVLRGLHGQTVETIGSRIVQGRYAPGAPLASDELEHEFGISKTVLREAMRVLAAKGLVDSRQKRGTIVRPRSAWSLLDPDLLRWQGGEPDATFLNNLAEVRSIVEPAGARLAATRRNDEDLEVLRAALEAMREADSDSEKMISADLLFHRALLNAAHNELLSQTGVVFEPGLRARDRVVSRSHSWRDSVPAHEAIVTAIEAGDGPAAQAAMDTLLMQASADTAAVIGGVTSRSRKGPVRRTRQRSGDAAR